MKTCRFCGETKPIGAFYATAGRKCKSCHKADSKAWHLANPEKAKASARKYRATPQGKATLRASKQRCYRAVVYSDTRMCRTCKEVKPVTSFFNEKDTRKLATCMDCCNEQRREKYHLDPEKARKHTRRWHRENPEKARASERAWHETVPGYHRERLYGLTLDQYHAMQERQDFMCAICLSDDRGNLHVDHDHKTTKVRGLLCRQCNTAIGMLQESAAIIERAAHYVSVA